MAKQLPTISEFPELRKWNVFHVGLRAAHGFTCKEAPMRVAEVGRNNNGLFFVGRNRIGVLLRNRLACLGDFDNLPLRRGLRQMNRDFFRAINTLLAGGFAHRCRLGLDRLRRLGFASGFRFDDRWLFGLGTRRCRSRFDCFCFCCHKIWILDG